ncbi:possible alpha/beta hydrolase superfamily [Geminocystis sp. NIES-3708]|uniref:alpha/beta fold hydrolase n=1 Tax=Geminocystis sp. NIES-3708 TaxID=1615909 RepID=UPI0005FCA0C7|nr:alpha/beta fold hydrolase [Geminocystis sp. NIES-3708]BAQ62404.1 possible alpha/beta hydrolase superfamily [Geminocystis sp. NIES-3708]
MINYQIWQWQGFNIGYQSYGEIGEVIVFIHGFGANSGHWRHNLPFLGQNYRCYAIDLLGFGASAKPTPGQPFYYTFETWSKQVADFCREIVKTPVYLIGNSIGCIVTMQTAVDNPDLVLGIAALNCSLRLLHDRKRESLPFYKNVGATVMQKLLTNKSIGNFFYRQIAKPKVIKNLLSQAYQNKEAITDELIDIIYKPSQDKGASDVFLAFTAYSGGALPEDLLPILPCPITFFWGTNDPWESIELGRELANYPMVKDFIELEGLGHCPQDEAPEIVNPLLRQWLETLEH